MAHSPDDIKTNDDCIAKKTADETPNIEFERLNITGRMNRGDETTLDHEEKYAGIKCLDNGRYQLSFHVPSIFLGIIIGKRGATKQRIESDTRTSIFIPRHDETGDIEIRSKNKDEILIAHQLIKELVARARSKHPYNRFISISMVNSEILENYRLFKEGVLNTCKDCSGISEDLFQNPAKFHLTANVMMLADDVENNLAIDRLISSKEDILNPLFGGRSLTVRVRGIEIMNDDPSKAKVLFAKIEDSTGLLQQLMDNYVDYFVKAGLMKKQREHVTLHMTLLNSSFIMEKLYGDTIPKTVKWHTFDASKILEIYKDYDFGTVEINEVQLACSHTETEKGYYETILNTLRMDVIDPHIEVIDGIPYRVNHSDDYNVLKNAETTPYIEFDEEKEVECGGDLVDADEYGVEVELLDDGYYLIQLHVPKEFHSIIIGLKGGTRQRLELETKTCIDVPKKHEKGKVEIKGKSRVGVLAAYRRIKILLTTARAKIPHTHFLSIPMMNAEIVKNFQRFKEEVLDTCGKCAGICEDLFQNPGKLHLTLGMILLTDDKERDIAVNTMISSKEDIIKPLFGGRALQVRVRGLQLMNDDPSEVKVLYAKVEDPSDEGLLQELADKMVDYFVDAGLIETDRTSVKLHMTVMNSVFLVKKVHGEEYAYAGSKKVKKWHFFDASKIMELYKDYDFGVMVIDSIHLSQRHTRTENGYYIATCKLMVY
ncbi:uncharacterized protein LOC135848338 [Planococcus citri]|uniref:uncharacterized protein LOC135848338 n=1 Tax=Planococcus citri TaxID=170843 RepID=UPI0031F75641